MAARILILTAALSLAACSTPNTTSQPNGVPAVPAAEKLNCPAEALVKPSKSPEPPTGINPKAVMNALGLEGWRWIWEYKAHNDERDALQATTYRKCGGKG